MREFMRVLFPILITYFFFILFPQDMHELSLLTFEEGKCLIQKLKDMRNKIEISSADSAKTYQGIERILENLNDMKNYLEDLWQKRAVDLQQSMKELRERETRHSHKKSHEHFDMASLKIVEPDFQTIISSKTSETTGPTYRDGYIVTEKRNTEDFESRRVTKRVNMKSYAHLLVYELKTKKKKNFSLEGLRSH